MCAVCVARSHTFNSEMHKMRKKYLNEHRWRASACSWYRNNGNGIDKCDRKQTCWMPSRPDHSILMFNHIFLSIFLFFIAISALIMSGMNETVDDRRLECVERCGMIFSPCIYIYICICSWTKQRCNKKRWNNMIPLTHTFWLVASSCETHLTNSSRMIVF